MRSPGRVSRGRTMSNPLKKLVEAVRQCKELLLNSSFTME
jgi:hypothetical protein